MINPRAPRASSHFLLVCLRARSLAEPMYAERLRSRALLYAENTVVQKENIDTRRIIGMQRGWGKWAILREFFQNTIDHLDLFFMVLEIQLS